MMSDIRVDTNWKFCDLRVIVLENKYLKVHILPELGAKIYDLIYKPSNYNFLWHNPRILPEKVSLGSNYDDHFSGGWDVLFPNDSPGAVRGENYPDHGEVWAQSWKFEITEVSSERCEIHLWCMGRVTPTLMETWISLEKEETKVRFRHKLTNYSLKSLDFLWKLHPAMYISPCHRIDVPGRKAEFVDPQWSRFGEKVKSFDWPMAKSPDGSLVKDYCIVDPVESGHKDFIYVKELKSGWCSITDTEKKIGMGLAFPEDIFTTVWLFLTYGGWRNLYTAILEPCMAYPKDLETAIKTKNCGHIESKGILEFEVMATVYTGLKSVKNIDKTGTVT